MNTSTVNQIFEEVVTIFSDDTIKIPKYFMEKLNLSDKRKVSLIYEDGKITIVNPVVHAMEKMQKEMEGKFEKAGLNDDEDIMDLVREIRAEVEGF